MKFTKGLPSSNWFLFFCMKSAAGLPDMLLWEVAAPRAAMVKATECAAHLEATLLGPTAGKSQGPGSQCYTAIFNAHIWMLNPFRSIGW